MVELLRQRLPQLNAFDYSTLILRTSWQCARALLLDMAIQHVQPDIYCFNGAFPTSDAWLQATELLHQPHRQGLRLDEFSFGLMVRAFPDEHWEAALQMIREAHTSGSVMALDRLNLVRIYSEHGIALWKGRVEKSLLDEKFVAARSEQLEVDVAFTTALSTTSTNGRQWPLSLHLGAHSSEADLLLLNAQLSAAWMGQRWQHALRLVVAALEQRMPIDDYGCSRVILACEENQKWHCSLNLLVSSHGVFSYSWTDFMSSRLRAGHWSSVLQLGSSLFPSTLTGELGIGELSLLVKSCQTWQKGLQLWHESPQELRQISGCNAAMALVAQQDTSAPHWPVAVELFTLARSGRLQPDELSFSSMPRRWPASVETTLRGLHVAQQPLDEVCLATLLRCGTWRFCLHTFLLGQRLRASPDETCYNACAASLCTSERWRETVELWLELKLPISPIQMKVRSRATGQVGERPRDQFLDEVDEVGEHLMLIQAGVQQLGDRHFQPIVYLDNSRRGRSPEPRPSYYGCTLSRDEIQVHRHPNRPRVRMEISAPTLQRGNKDGWMMLDEALFLGWALAVFTWLVVWGVQRMLWDAQKIFVQRRIEWLQRRPKPQSSTILVSNIPPRYRSDSKLKTYFERLFPDGTIESVYIVKHLHGLVGLLQDFDDAEQKLHEAHYQRHVQGQGSEVETGLSFYTGCFDIEECFLSIVDAAQSGVELYWDPEMRPKITLQQEAEPVDSIEHYTRLLEHLTRLVETERQQIKSADAFTQESLCGASGFVTFKASRDAEMALRLRLEPEGPSHLFTMKYAPAPKDVAYEDLLASPWQRQVSHLFGYVLIFTVFLLFFPFIGLASSIVNLENLEQMAFIKQIITSSSWLQSFLEGIFATLLLSLFMSFLPTTLSFIIDKTFTLTSRAESQLYLQEWYYWFQVIFVLLVTAVGTSLWQRFNDVLTSPKGVLFDFAGSLPNTSTFYIDYVILQWSVTVLNVLRYQNLVKFLAWNTICDEDRAKNKSEPEDQDYYGVGSRSARLSLVLAIGLVFSLLSPFILIVVFLFFLINRLVFGYLLVFAELPKPDLGGIFWAQQLRHVHLILPIFVLTMSGCIWVEPYGGPGMFCLLSLGIWAYEYSRWSDILWETLPFRAVVEGAERGTDTSEERYVQEELTRTLRTKTPAIKAG
ncbi:CSC1-like protein At4g02900 [Durusdinium trenchii]|uniref:CSC1-like protein At4g02900 n=1 Tax=Durusdinium trenchii TaxID=1381693 RepID=A0ABP0SNP2_9DINO